MVTIPTPKLVPIPGSFRISSVFTLVFDHVWSFVND